MVAMHGELDIFHEERFCRLGDRSQFTSQRMLSTQGGTDDPYILQDLRSGTHQILFFCVSANGYGWWQFLLMQDDNQIVGRACNGKRGLSVGYVEEFQRVAGDFYLETAIRAGDPSELEFGDTKLDIFDAFALVVDNSTFDGDTFLCP